MNPQVFADFRDLIYAQSGISLVPGKQTLLQSRISKRMRALGIDQERAYLRHITEDRSGEEMVRLLDAVSTNVTYFYREPEHFGHLQQAMRRWLRDGQRRIRIWSAACSSGQEPYTIAMSALDVAGSAPAGAMDLKILATDISTRVLEAASRGVYAARDLERVPEECKERYFTASHDAGEAIFGVRDRVRQLVTFKRLNLSKPPFPMRGPMDAIFCRNVMIYFDNHVRTRLVEEMERLLKPGGLLFIGHAESLIGLPTRLRSLSPSVYQMPEGS